MNYLSKEICIDRDIYNKLKRLANMNQVCIDRNLYNQLEKLANMNKPSVHNLINFSNFSNFSNLSNISNLPNEIVFIRHGEKKDKHDDGDLNKTGKKHADCWVQFFLNNRPSTIGIPQSLYAMKMDITNKTPSNRPYNTILPLSLPTALNLPINNNYLRDDSKGVITDILSSENTGKNVLVCWEHKAIVDLVNEIIKQVYISNGKNCDLKIKNWGNDVAGKKDDSDDYSTLWQIKFEENSMKLYVYAGCAVDSSKNCNFYADKNKNPTLFSC